MADLETSFRKKIVGVLQRDVFVEYLSSMTRGGIPDLHMVWPPDGLAVWAELKAVRAPETARTKRASDYGFTALQRSWLLRVQDAGGWGLGIVGIKQKIAWECVIITAGELPVNGLTWADLEERPRFSVDGELYGNIRRCVEGARERGRPAD